MKKTNKIALLALLISLYTSALAQDSTTLSLLFIGDIMGHDSQINSAKTGDNTYNYEPVFQYLKDDIGAYDVCIANLEVTLAGPPFKGYPQFSSPDALAEAAKNAGVDILATANNHSVDRGKKGIERTIHVLDSLGIRHTGTYVNTAEKKDKSPLIIDQNGIRVALLNYTYGTNGIPVPEPCHINLNNDRKGLINDIQTAKNANVDKILLFIHWGTEYQQQPNKAQKELATFCFEQGVDYIIGSHPHVLQPSQWFTDSISQKEHFIAYSLGNFVSNQRKRYTDGGQLIGLTLQKTDSRVSIKECGHILTWVYKTYSQQKATFHVIPCARYELQPEFFQTADDFKKMQLYISDARNLLNTYNNAVREYIYFEDSWQQ